MIIHADFTLFGGGKSFDNRGLNDGHQSHIRICRYRDRTQQIGCKAICHIDGGRAICSSDDADRRSFLDVKTPSRGHHDRYKDAKLRRSAKKQHERILEQWSKIDHSPNGDKDEQREKLGIDPGFEQHCQRSMLSYSGRHGDVCKDSTKTYRQQQCRFIFLADRQPYQYYAHDYHDQLRKLKLSKGGKHYLHCDSISSDKLHSIYRVIFCQGSSSIGGTRYSFCRNKKPG